MTDIQLSDPHFAEKERACAALRAVIDPELFINIIDLGLIYQLDFSEKDIVKVEMTLSTPHCPMGESMVNSVRYVLEEEFLGQKVEVELVWEPAWSMDRITEEGRQQLGIN
jgi:metal-sulfur cluster biosynthetic enzyme